QYRGNDGGEGSEAFGGDDINDVVNLIPLAEKLPCADMSQIGMLGYSRGGMMAYLAAKSGAPLKAVAVIGAPTNLLETYRDRDDIREAFCKLIGGPPSECKDEYIRRSAYYWPEKLKVPFLILHGENDWRVDVNQSKKLVQKLEKLNSPHFFEIFPGSDHNLSIHRNERNTMIFEWFDTYLRT
ncbi:MAG: alpha/beta hydrolase family protein, partial [bacterium]